MIVSIIFFRKLLKPFICVASDSDGSADSGGSGVFDGFEVFCFLEACLSVSTVGRFLLEVTAAGGSGVAAFAGVAGSGSSTKKINPQSYFCLPGKQGQLNFRFLTSGFKSPSSSETGCVNF